MTPQTPTDRQRAYKARHRAAGRKEVRNLWANPEDVPQIRALATLLQRKREKAKLRFSKTYCSQCDGEFGPGDSGFSHCADHKAPA